MNIIKKIEFVDTLIKDVDSRMDLVNQIRAKNLNEIKSVVNFNADYITNTVEVNIKDKQDTLIAGTNITIISDVISTHTESGRSYTNNYNIQDYKELASGSNWTNAFIKMAADCADQSDVSIFIPKYENNYYINSRFTLTGLKRFRIIGDGTIAPVNGQEPQIGTFDMVNCSDGIIEGLNFWGNKDNTPDTNIGLQSLVRLNNCDRLKFINLTFKQTHQTAINGDYDLTNISFENINFEDIGEHPFYFGGTNYKNFYFKNINVNGFGTGAPNESRTINVVKFRTKIASDIKAENIILDNIKAYDNKVVSGNRQLLGAYNVRTVTILNSSIIGASTSLLSINTGTDRVYVDNCVSQGKYLIYGISSENPGSIGEQKITIRNSKLIGSISNLGDIALMENCDWTAAERNFNNSLDKLERNTTPTFRNNRINILTNRIHIDQFNHKTFIFENNTFFGTTTAPYFELSKNDTILNGDIIFRNNILQNSITSFCKIASPFLKSSIFIGNKLNAIMIVSDFNNEIEGLIKINNIYRLTPGFEITGKNGVLNNNIDYSDFSNQINILQEKLIAGDNITIVGDTISATGCSSIGGVWEEPELTIVNGEITAVPNLFNSYNQIVLINGFDGYVFSGSYGAPNISFNSYQNSSENMIGFSKNSRTYERITLSYSQITSSLILKVNGVKRNIVNINGFIIAGLKVVGTKTVVKQNK